MGSVVGTAASGVDTFLGNVLAAPFKALFGASCKDVCSGMWDFPCFLEHLCLLSMVRMFVALIICYLILCVMYVVFKLGIFQCVAKKTRKATWRVCSGSCHLLGGACSFLWHKVRDTKRMHRSRRPYVEEGGLSSSYSDTDFSNDGDQSTGNGSTTVSQARGKSPSSVWERRKDRLRRSLRLRRIYSKDGHASRIQGSVGKKQHRHFTIDSRRAELYISSMRMHGEARHGRSRAQAHREDEG
ncbi:hypothetical protein ACP70R_029000 [Stipagrostis hirtigluma subsp. patula]